MAVSNILFISENTLKNDSVIQQNVDPQLVSPFIKTAQEIYIEPLLGITLTDELKALIDANNVTGNWEILLVKYIQPAMIYYSLYEAAPYISVKWTNKSLVRKDSDNSTALSLEEVKDLRTMVQNTAEQYRMNLKRYLDDNLDLFPNYSVRTNQDICLGNVKNNMWFSGIQF